MSDPHKVTVDFEKAICEYTGAPYAVAVNSCTAALLLALAWHLRDSGPAHGGMRFPMDWEERPRIEIPKLTYISVPQVIVHAGGRPTFRDEDWIGQYQLKPLPVWDAARWFTSRMYGEHHRAHHSMVCVSFHSAKTLGDTQGGAILHDNHEADGWLRRARFDGRTEHVPPKHDTFDMVGWHCYLSPDVAARLLLKLAVLPAHNEPLPSDEYPDLSLMRIFQ